MIILLIIFMFFVFGVLGYYLGFRVGGEEDRKLTLGIINEEKEQIAKEVENWRLAKVQYRKGYTKLFSRMRALLIGLGADENKIKEMEEKLPRMKQTKESALEEYYESLQQNLANFPRPDISIRIPRE